MSEHSNWSAMLAEFRALGGIAENVDLRSGPLGRGLFSIDPDRPVKVAVPENLLIDLENIRFEDDQIRIKDEAPVPRREREFFEAYEREFSWGGGGREDCEAFFAQADALPQPLRRMLVTDFGWAALSKQNQGPERIRRRFLRSRAITVGPRQVLMPVVDLANHETRGIPFSPENGIAIEGHFAGEVFAHYGIYDPMGFFERWGFSRPEAFAYSLPAFVKLRTRRLEISRKLAKERIMGDYRFPEMESDKDRVGLSFLMLGNARFSRRPKGIFYRLMEEIGEPDAEALFDQIRRFNTQQFLKLSEALEDLEGPLPSALRGMCRHQILAISHAVGAEKI